jgi:phosphoribosylformimino-5-aminoimidazole carboxamide ribotide isomerase
VAVLIPSIDLMGGKIVQLVQGEKKELEFDDFDYWIDRFSKYPIVQVIDLDAAQGTGSNVSLVHAISQRLNCQVGGGIRTVKDARNRLDAGAKKVIIGSALLSEGRINTAHARVLAEDLGAAALVFAVDSRGGQVAIDGWKTKTSLSAVTMVEALEPFCEAFLYTHIDTEGLMQGIPLKTVETLRRATSRRLIAAGGIASQREIDALDAMGVDAVVGMALYTGRIPG